MVLGRIDVRPGIVSETPSPHDAPLSTVLSQWDALVVRWDLDGEERFALLVGMSAGQIDQIASYDVSGVERRMRLLLELEPVLGAVFVQGERIRAWLRRTNRQLGYRTPLDVMASSPEWIRWLINSLDVAK